MERLSASVDIAKLRGRMVTLVKKLELRAQLDVTERQLELTRLVARLRSPR